MRIVRPILFLSLALVMASCRPLSLYFVQPSGPPEYKLGWEDGCDTGLAASGSGVGKAIYGYKKRPELLDNQLYNTAWNEGFTYCRFSLDSVDKNQWFN
jgi:hypothetical protein